MIQFKEKTHFKEATSPSQKGSKFEVVLIQEGMGNLKDCFYYTKQSLQGAPSIFEGKKCYADHPSALEENIRPERSTRDILGYYQNVRYDEAEDGRGRLIADLVTVGDPNLSWANSLLATSLQYAQQFTESDFVGLSINANGEADNMPLDEFLKQTQVPPSVMPKLQEAQAQGIDTIRVVSALKDAMSVDLVTDAGAGGRIFKMIEQEKKPMKKAMRENTKEAGINPKDNETLGEAGINSKDNQALGEAGEGGEGLNTLGGAQPDHADAEQDTALFKQLVSEYLGADHGSDEEEAMQLAKHAYESCREDGMDHDTAMKQAGSHLKMAHSIGKRMKQGAPMESEPKEGECNKEDDAAPDATTGASNNMESMRKTILKLTAENLKLKESINKYEIADHIEKLMTEKKYPSALTKRFRESLGPVKSKDEVNKYWKYFLAAREGVDEEVTNDFSDCIVLEKTTGSKSSGAAGSQGYGDCI